MYLLDPDYVFCPIITAKIKEQNAPNDKNKPSTETEYFPIFIIAVE